MSDRINFVLLHKENPFFILNINNIYYSLNIERIKKSVIVDGFDPVTSIKFYSRRMNGEPNLTKLEDYPELYYWNSRTKDSIFDHKILRYGESFSYEYPVDEFTQIFKFLKPQSSSQNEPVSIAISPEMVNINTIHNVSFGIYAHYSNGESNENTGMLSKSAIINPFMKIKVSPHEYDSNTNSMIAGLSNPMSGTIDDAIRSKLSIDNTEVFLTRDFREVYTKYRNVINSEYYRRKGGSTNFYIFVLHQDWTVKLYK